MKEERGWQNGGGQGHLIPLLPPHLFPFVGLHPCFYLRVGVRALLLKRPGLFLFPLLLLFSQQLLTSTDFRVQKRNWIQNNTPLLLKSIAKDVEYT